MFSHVLYPINIEYRKRAPCVGRDFLKVDPVGKFEPPKLQRPNHIARHCDGPHVPQHTSYIYSLHHKVKEIGALGAQ